MDDGRGPVRGGDLGLTEVGADAAGADHAGLSDEVCSGRGVFGVEEAAEGHHQYDGDRPRAHRRHDRQADAPQEREIVQEIDVAQQD